MGKIKEKHEFIVFSAAVFAPTTPFFLFLTIIPLTQIRQGWTMLPGWAPPVWRPPGGQHGSLLFMPSRQPVAGPLRSPAAWPMWNCNQGNNNKSPQQTHDTTYSVVDGVNLPKTSPTCEKEFLVRGTFKTPVESETWHNIIWLSRFLFFFFFCQNLLHLCRSHQAAASRPVGFLQSVDGHLQGEVNATRCSRLKYQYIRFLSPSHCSDWGPTQIASCLQACK